MDLTRPWTRALAGACALTLIVAACGDDEDGSDDAEQTTEAVDETTGSTEAEPESTASEPEEETTTSEGGESESDPEAVAKAEAINLTIDDFAEGWTEEPQSDDAETDPFDECFTGTDIESATVGEAETGNFQIATDDSGAGQGVSMQTIVLDSPETATAVVDEALGDEFAACLQEFLSTQLLEGVEATLAPQVDDPPLTEQSGGVVGQIAIPNEGGPSDQGLIDMHVFRTAEVVSFTLTVDSVGDQTFQATLTELYGAVAERQTTEAG
jgi:hypothetical protein